MAESKKGRKAKPESDRVQQRSIYVKNDLWESLRKTASLYGKSTSEYAVMLIREHHTIIPE